MIEFFEMIYWRHTSLLLLLALPIVFLLINYLKQRWQWKNVADDSLQPWLKTNQNTSQSISHFLSLTIAWLCFVIALAGPRLIESIPPELQSEPTSLVIILDLSASMNAEDAYPNRKSQSIQWIQNSLSSKPKQLKMGFIVFAGHAFNLMPPTLDKAIIEHFIAQLTPLSLPTLGNDLSAALALAKQQFKPQQDKQPIVILSDGDLSKPEQQRAHAYIKDDLQQQHISLISFGHTKAVQLPKASGGYVLSNGRPVQSRIQSQWFKQLSKLSHVTYQTYDSIKHNTLKETIRLKTKRINPEVQQHVTWLELYPYPLTLGLLFFVFNLWRLNLKKHSLTIGSHLLVMSFIIATLLSVSPTSQANSDLLLKANNALKAQNYPLAEKLFNQINTPLGAYGEGIACYRQDNFQCATRAFSKAAWQANNEKLKSHAIFNLGNSYFFLGEYDQAAVLFEDAKKHGFNTALAQRNLKFAQTMQQAVLQRIKDIKDVFRRAKWKAARLGNPPPSLSNIVSSQNNFASNAKNKTPNFIIRQAISQQVKQQLGLSQSSNTQTKQWIQTERIENQSTVQLLKRLLEMDIAIPAPLKEPKPIEGKQAW